MAQNPVQQLLTRVIVVASLFPLGTGTRSAGGPHKTARAQRPPQHVPEHRPRRIDAGTQERAAEGAWEVDAKTGPVSAQAPAQARVRHPEAPTTA
jgi:hypothetical protein